MHSQATAHNGSIRMAMDMEIIKAVTILMPVLMTSPVGHAQPLTASVALTAMAMDIQTLIQVGLHIQLELLTHSQSPPHNGMIPMAMGMAMRL
jgi:hypothetical protein